MSDSDEFLILIERWQKTDDPEVVVTAVQAALHLEPKLRQWPLRASREQVKGQLLHALGEGYQERLQGSRADNLEAAIQAYAGALNVANSPSLPTRLGRDAERSRESLPQSHQGLEGRQFGGGNQSPRGGADRLYPPGLPEQWAMAQDNLGCAYRQRIKGSKADNMVASVKAHEAALTVLSREASPQQWAMAQDNLACAYRDRITCSKAGNVELAIAAHQAALTVFTREALPQDWARTQHNLGITYHDRIEGPNAGNMEKAIEAYEAALTVRTREAFPQDWAHTQISFGLACHDRIKGSKADNLEVAIEAYEAALTVLTREVFPQQWAMAQINLGVAYSNRIKGSKADNLEVAIEAHGAALSVRTCASPSRETGHIRKSISAPPTAIASRTRLPTIRKRRYAP